MAKSRSALRAGLITLAAFNLFVCMVTEGVYAGAPPAQTEFTPHVTTLATTQTADSLRVGTVADLDRRIDAG